AVTGQSAQELPASKLTASVRMCHTAGDVTAHRDGVLEGCDGQSRLHSRVDRVSDDPTTERVLDGAEVELALRGLVLRDVDQPEFVRLCRGEHVPHPAIVVDHRAEVVVDRRAGPAPLAALAFTERAEP